MSNFRWAFNVAPAVACLLCIAAVKAPPSTASNSTGASLGVSQVSITEDGQYRVIDSNGIPNHSIGQFPGPGNPNSISAQTYHFRVRLKPVANAVMTPLKRQAIGVAINGVPFDPGTAEFWKNDPKSGWHKEAIVGSQRLLGLDHNNGHVQPNGAYHYHALPTGLIQESGSGTPKSMTLIGYAADGFGVYAAYAHDKAADASSALREMKPSWRLKQGVRPSANNGPGGVYDGTYSEDYEFMQGSGDLDAANGRTGVTPEHPQGSYYYMATATFPFYPRSLKGTPDQSFQRQGPPPGGPGGSEGVPKGGPGRRPGPPPGPPSGTKPPFP